MYIERINPVALSHRITAPCVFVELLLVSRIVVLRDKIFHIALCISKLHLAHALDCVPVEKCLAPKHVGELLRHTLPNVLNLR